MSLTQEKRKQPGNTLRVVVHPLGRQFFTFRVHNLRTREGGVLRDIRIFIKRVYEPQKGTFSATLVAAICRHFPSLFYSLCSNLPAVNTSQEILVKNHIKNYIRNTQIRSYIYYCLIFHNHFIVLVFYFHPIEPPGERWRR